MLLLRRPSDRRYVADADTDSNSDRLAAKIVRTGDVAGVSLPRLFVERSTCVPETTVDLREAILGPTPTKEQILDRIEGEQIRFINLQFTDVMGIVKSVTIPPSIFEHVDRRRAVDRRLVDRRLHPHRRIDMYLMPDLSTFAVIPWETGEYTTARVICWVFNPNGDPFPGDPRGVLYRQLERAGQAGLHLQDRPGAGVLPLPKDGDGISPLPHDRGRLLRLLDRPRLDRPQGHGDRAGADGHRGRDEPPRGRRSASTRSTSSTATRCRPPTAP